MKIAFYISNHGFGHILRNLPVNNIFIERDRAFSCTCNCNKTYAAGRRTSYKGVGTYETRVE